MELRLAANADETMLSLPERQKENKEYALCLQHVKKLPRGQYELNTQSGIFLCMQTSQLSVTSKLTGEVEERT